MSKYTVSPDLEDLESIKSRQYSLYTDIKLQECASNLPEFFFPNYTNVRENCEIRWELKSGKAASMVKKHASANKKACYLKKNPNSKRPCENLANKDSNNKETGEDDKKEKGPENSKKKAWWQGNKEKAEKLSMFLLMWYYYGEQ